MRPVFCGRSEWSDIEASIMGGESDHCKAQWGKALQPLERASQRYRGEDSVSRKCVLKAGPENVVHMHVSVVYTT